MESNCFSGLLRPDWGHTTRADTDGLGSIGLLCQGYFLHHNCLNYVTLPLHQPIFSFTLQSRVNYMSTAAN